ncbi:hypothetical protein QYM36_012889 [Artemia franciscana]|uniref:Uncharacterized protein n=1 Tax=Artemia franciscana TaxID=6661 RepID=A0AA88L8D8_ARTSF|nr:hypothetical protein QYM36_012889 [Artemia franciscana]
MLKFLPKLHRIYYKSRFKIEGKNIKEINAELDMVFEFVEYVLGKGGITCMQTKCISGQTLLHHAVWEGKADLCNLLIKSGAELDATNVYGETPLGTAIRTSNLDLVKCFQSQSSSTAVSTSNLDLVKFLLNRGANPNCGECLHIAVREERADICKLLVGFGAKLDAMNAFRETPLLIAIRSNNLELVKLLLKRGANPNCGECLHLAVKNGSADLCNLLIKSGAELDATNVYGKTPLGTAISTSNLDLVKCCQSQSSSTAISTSNLDLVKFLLNRGANPNCGECLHHAVKEGRADICKLLIGFGAKLDAMNAKKDTPLLIAIRNNNLELVKLLLKRGANPNCGEYLHLAVKKGSADVCNLLIKSGAEIDATNVHGETPLGTAIKTSNVDLVKLLLKRGANPNCGACLHLAVEKGRSDLCELLIDSGANLDAMNANKEYPLHVAVRNKNLELVNFLLVKAKTDPNCGRKRRRNAEEHETVILQEKMDLDNATLSVSKRCRISKDAMSK